MSIRATVLVVAAGNSSRMGENVNKQFLCIKNKPVLAYTLEAFEVLEEVYEIVVVTRTEDIPAVKALAEEYGINKVTAVISGGKTRQESVYLGLQSVKEEHVLIHDGARPFVTDQEIKDVLEALVSYDAALPAVPLKDTIKRVNADYEAVETLQREALMAVQTPQGFRTKMIFDAHAKVREDGVAVTDDASIAEYMGIPVKIVKGSYQNIKITTPEDILLAEAILSER